MKSCMVEVKRNGAYSLPTPIGYSREGILGTTYSKTGPLPPTMLPKKGVRPSNT